MQVSVDSEKVDTRHRFAVMLLRCYDAVELTFRSLRLAATPLVLFCQLGYRNTEIGNICHGFFKIKGEDFPVVHDQFPTNN